MTPLPRFVEAVSFPARATLLQAPRLKARPSLLLRHPRRFSLANSRARQAVGLVGPILVVAQEVALIPEIHGGPEEEPPYAQVAHPLKAPVGGIDTATNDGETLSPNFLAQAVIFSKLDLLVESAELPEFLAVEQHEHPCRKRTMQVGQVLEEVVAGIKQLVDPGSVLAEDVSSDTVELPGLCLFHAAADERIISEFDIGVEKEKIRRIGLRCALIPSVGGHAALDYADSEPVAEAHDDFWGAIGGIGVSDQHSRTRHLRVILIRQRGQQTRNQLRFVFRRNHDG